MCGIVGFTGEHQAAPILLDGLAKLEYRGYDSAGIAVRDGDADVEVIKAKGRLKVLAEKTNDGETVKGTCGIGHTRWATHGEPSENNAHPHKSDDGNVVAVHNGIIENYQELKNKLGHFAYILHGIREVFKIRRLKLRIETEDEVYENKYIFVAINNAKKVGGIMRLDKAHVEFNDGEFELMLVEFPKDFIQLMKTVGKIFMQDFSGNITFKQIKSAKITKCSDVNWSLDGEKEKAHDFVEFKVIHNAINFIY